MIEKNDLFDYDLYIYQNKDYFKFSLDSILLAEFVKSKPNQKVLDMCTGNCPVPLILRTKNNDLEIDCVEIQPEIIDLARKSIEVNKQEDKINLIEGNVKDVKINKKYDIITCNPPYFKVDGTSLTNENEIKKIARHEVTITLKEIIDTAAKNLNENGIFYMVHRSDRLIDVINCLNENKLGIRTICYIFTKENSASEFFLIEAAKNKKNDTKIYYRNVYGLTTYKNIF